MIGRIGKPEIMQCSIHKLLSTNFYHIPVWPMLNSNFSSLIQMIQYPRFQWLKTAPSKETCRCDADIFRDSGSTIEIMRLMWLPWRLATLPTAGFGNRGSTRQPAAKMDSRKWVSLEFIEMSKGCLWMELRQFHFADMDRRWLMMLLMPWLNKKWSLEHGMFSDWKSKHFQRPCTSHKVTVQCNSSYRVINWAKSC